MKADSRAPPDGVGIAELLARCNVSNSCHDEASARVMGERGVRHTRMVEERAAPEKMQREREREREPRLNVMWSPRDGPL